MRRALAGMALSFGLGYLAYKVLTVNPLWFRKFAPTPESVPEALAREAREKGWL